jgi:3-oxoacid CoA-transferase subunit A
MDKVYPSAAAAVADISTGASPAVGGFRLSGIPQVLINAVVSNNCGVDDGGLGILLRNGRTARMTSSYVGENKEFARQVLAGELSSRVSPPESKELS